MVLSQHFSLLYVSQEFPPVGCPACANLMILNLSYQPAFVPDLHEEIWYKARTYLLISISEILQSDTTFLRKVTNLKFSAMSSQTLVPARSALWRSAGIGLPRRISGG